MIGEEFVRSRINKYAGQIKSKIRPILLSILEEDERKMKSLSSLENSNETNSTENEEDEISLSSEKKRNNLVKNLTKEEEKEHFDAIEKARQTSMLHSQGQADHSGSGYHGPGKPGSGKNNSNMWQRNFDNHQGN